MLPLGGEGGQGGKGTGEKSLGRQEHMHITSTLSAVFRVIPGKGRLGQGGRGGERGSFCCDW